MGKLILLNTALGSTTDLSSRVIEAFREGVQFAVEDTRSFKDLLRALEIEFSSKKIFSLHDHSSEAKWLKLLELLNEGDLYVASEAGSPVISDPAYPLVKLAYEKNHVVESYSGVSAITLGLELSGLPPIPFHFHGFLGREKSDQRGVFENLSKGTHLFFESPLRIRKTLELVAELYPHNKVVVIKEMTKTYQTVYRFEAQNHQVALENLVEKGEFVWLIYLSEETKLYTKEWQLLAQEIVDHGVSSKTLSKLLGGLLDKSPKEIYKILAQNNLPPK